MYLIFSVYLPSALYLGKLSARDCSAFHKDSKNGQLTPLNGSISYAIRLLQLVIIARQQTSLELSS
ncbi:hypothetical protein EJ02DRAFT_450597 [Clathrospora elynae]|uniref:Uncharacterized protein n=1 Tax=Clathrospora elynae TaxID=706981 RepID=A0A6A5T469_9PLEO|nr:hypothetical protein EJ02DRAFT_450597 [Clathrospora elynae]